MLRHNSALGSNGTANRLKKNKRLKKSLLNVRRNKDYKVFAKLRSERISSNLLQTAQLEALITVSAPM